MAAILTGTPVAVAWGTSQNPAGQSITIPSDATAVYMFWAFDGVDANGHGLASATLNSANPAQTFEVATGSGFLPGTGVAAWYNTATGSQTLDVAWDIAPVEGPVCIVVFVKDGDTTAWRDADGARAIETTAVSVTLTTVSGDLVLKFDQRYDSLSNLPDLTSGWTNGQTQTGQASENARLSYISATTTTQVCASENESYSSIVAISIPAAPSGTSVALTGTSSTSAVGTAGPTSSKALSGASAFSALGTPAGTRTLPITGETATGAVGSVIASSGNTLELSGVGASGSAGTVVASSGSSVSITGVSAAAAVGTTPLAISIPAAGIAAASASGTLQAASQVQTAGARRRHLGPHPAIPVWQLGKFARRRRNNNTVPSVTAALSGVQASTAVSSVSVARTLNTLTGAAAVGSPGSVDAETRVREGSRRRSGGVFPGRGFYSFARYYKSRRNTEADPTSAQALSGVAGSATRGSVTPTRSIAVSGVQATSAAGSISASQAGAASLTTVAGVGAAGGLAPGIQINLAGVVATASAGDVTAVAGVVLAISGVQGATQIQTLTASAAKELSGTAASGTIGSMSGSTPGTWVPVNTRTSSESWNPFAG